MAKKWIRTEGTPGGRYFYALGPPPRGNSGRGVVQVDNAVICVKVNEHDEALREHGRRLDKIEQDAAEFRVHIQNLCSKIDELTGWIKALMLAMVGTFGGFIIWYIQSLPR